MKQKSKKNMSSIERQVDAVFRHTRQGSYDTRFRYRDSCKLFARFLHNKFRVQNARNLHDKHLVAFIEHRKTEGISSKTLKNDLAAIRFMHDQVPRTRYELSTNQELKERYGISLESTPSIHGNRAWTEVEYEGIKALAMSLGRTREANIITLCRSMGLRIAEASAVKRHQAELALRTGIYIVGNEAKNGKNREVPLSPEAREVFERVLPAIERGENLFVDRAKGETVHTTIMDTINFIRNHREKVTTNQGRELRTWVDRNGKTHTWELTAHGLRYNYIQERVQEEMSRGFTLEQACQRVVREVGHERVEIMRTYLGK